MPGHQRDVDGTVIPGEEVDFLPAEDDELGADPRTLHPSSKSKAPVKVRACWGGAAPARSRDTRVRRRSRREAVFGVQAVG